MKRRKFLNSLVVPMSSLMLPAAFAQEWPARPVKIIVATPAGSGVDAIGRILGDHLTKTMANSVYVENKTGGQNMVAAMAAARAPADGYTIYLATTAALVTNVYLFKDMAYDPRKDFLPVGFVAMSPFAIFTAADSKITSLQSFIQAAKARPGQMSLATEGAKSFGGITARLLCARAGITANLVSYTSSGVALQDLMGGRLDAFVADVASSAALVRQGKVRMLAVTSPKRLVDWDVPSVSETLPGFDMVAWFAMVAPAGTPSGVIAKLNKSLEVALSDRATIEKIQSIGPMTSGAGRPDELASFLTLQHRRWADISKEVGQLPE